MALSARSTVSNSSGGGCAQRQRQQQQEQDIAVGSLLTLLVESIKELAQAQQQMIIDQAEDRIDELRLEEQRQLSQDSERSRERAFRCRAELMDLARKYRKLNAELNLSDERSRQLSEFYLGEVRNLEKKIRQLEFWYK